MLQKKLKTYGGSVFNYFFFNANKVGSELFYYFSSGSPTFGI